MLATTQTAQSFGFKWKKFPIISSEWQRQLKTWFLEMYDYTLPQFKHFIDGKKVLDAGCGMAWRTEWFRQLNPSGTVVGLDIAREAVKTGKKLWTADVIVASLDTLPFSNDFFDYIACEGVIHHTPDPQRFLARLVEVLKPAGSITLYVYKKKPFLRALVDSAVREKTTRMSATECLDFCKKITLLGKQLYELDGTVEVPDIPALGVEAGKYTVQSFIYQYFLKCFWDWADQDYDRSLAINFDWYSPELAHSFSRHELEDLLSGCGLRISSIRELMSAFAVKAQNEPS